MKENFWGGGMGLSECCALHFFLHDSFRSAVMILLMLLSLFFASLAKLRLQGTCTCVFLDDGVLASDPLAPSSVWHVGPPNNCYLATRT